ncbi:thioredoxin-dependent thiol peroxidase [Sphingobium nicotianae]|uniref:thioredoxin-dependent peroxiredoxin n=1 Tax=Sphingobium nicotianae TaxID=2782607 RepID=A0A9X1DAY6_9SPHN|nr:thioredoxin-dependent thiol peroxidase [Sphingobium nicotianae]MBT2186591.1 thioredoxin-dependent thiol peroxidase [Sphingobium nicotianae]
MLCEGDTLPDVTLTGADGAPLKLSAYRGKPLVVYFYPKADTPGCTTEAIDFSGLIDDFGTLGVPVIAVSKDPVKKLNRFAEKHGLAVTLASDGDGSVCEAFGTWVEKSLYGREYMGIARATFLADKDGRIVRVWPKVKVKGHAAEVLAAGKALG